MPLHLPPVSRRRFLAGSLAGAACLTLPRMASADNDAVDRWALLSDPHIAAKREAKLRGVCMAEHLSKVLDELLALEPKPGNVLINGDCACTSGETGDYDLLVDMLGPLTKAGWPLHFTLGNHDHRERFATALAATDSVQPLAGRYVSIVEGRQANWFLLDSLEKTNVVTGRLGDDQLAWLAKALDARADKPALVSVHHNPDTSAKPTGLADTGPLVELLMARKQVKALFFGHTHHWDVKTRDGLHLVNLPAVAYVFWPPDPSGWVNCEVRPSGMRLELRALDPNHAAHGKPVELTWR